MPLGSERLPAPDRIRMGIRSARRRSRRTKKSGERRRRKPIVEQKQQRLHDTCRVFKIAFRARLLRSFRKRMGMVLGLVRLLYGRRIRKPARRRTHSRQHRPHGTRRRMECRSIRLLAVFQKLREPRFPLQLYRYARRPLEKITIFSVPTPQIFLQSSPSAKTHDRF